MGVVDRKLDGRVQSLALCSAMGVEKETAGGCTYQRDPITGLL